LRLVLTPGISGKPGAFSAQINGVLLAVTIPAWGAAPVGRIGLFAGPGALVAADALTVDASVTHPPTIEDHFLDNRLHWSAGQPSMPGGLLHNGLLRVEPVGGQLWRMASTRLLVLPVAPGASFTVEMALAVHAPTTGQPGGSTPVMGGLVFARPPAGSTTSALAAVVDSAGRVAIVSLTSGKEQTLAGPRATSYARRGQGLNVLRVHVRFLSNNTIQVGVAVNGSGDVLSFTGPGQQLAPAAGIVAVGPAAKVDASVVRIWI
jgi:hypothetical protein